MSLTRMICLFLGALIIMLAVVILRAETTRLHHGISQLDRRDDVLRQKIRVEQIALHRERSPAELLERVRQMAAQPNADFQRSRARTTEP